MREKRAHEFEDRAIENAQSEQQRGEIFFLKKQSLKVMCPNTKRSGMCVTGIPGEENEYSVKRKRWSKKVLAIIFSNLVDYIALKIQES